MNFAVRRLGQSYLSKSTSSVLSGRSIPALSSTTSVRYLSEGDAPASSSSSPISPSLEPLYNDITKLKEEEVNILGALVLQILGRKIFPGQFGKGIDADMLAAAAAAADAAGAGASEDAAAAAKTAFTIKLVGFDAKAKIKVIKEVRAIAGLGLKEAKELVESAPKAIQKDVTQDKADELKAQLEAVGAQIEIE